jgi:hypothetical protein
MIKSSTLHKSPIHSTKRKFVWLTLAISSTHMSHIFLLRFESSPSIMSSRKSIIASKRHAVKIVGLNCFQNCISLHVCTQLSLYEHTCAFQQSAISVIITLVITLTSRKMTSRDVTTVSTFLSSTIGQRNVVLEVGLIVKGRHLHPTKKQFLMKKK